MRDLAPSSSADHAARAASSPPPSPTDRVHQQAKADAAAQATWASLQASPFGIPITKTLMDPETPPGNPTAVFVIGATKFQRFVVDLNMRNKK